MNMIINHSYKIKRVTVSVVTMLASVLFATGTYAQTGYGLWVTDFQLNKEVELNAQNWQQYMGTDTSFDPANSTLSLNGTYFDHLYSSIPKLTVIISGSSSCRFIRFRATDTVTSGTLTFEPIDYYTDVKPSLNMSGDQDLACVKGFSKFFYNGFTIMDDGAYYDESAKELKYSYGPMCYANFEIITLYAPHYSRQDADSDSILVTLTNNNIPATGGPAYGNIKYTITYSNNTTGASDVTYTNPFKVGRTATLKAWVQLNETKSSELVCKYFGFQNNLTSEYQPSIQAPAISPALPTGITIKYRNNAAAAAPINTIDENTGEISISGLASESFGAYTEDFAKQVYNENGSMVYVLNNHESYGNSYICNLGTFSLTVTAKTITQSMIKLTPTSTQFTYNGSVQKPEVVVKDGETTLTEGTDYELTNEGGTNVGEYPISIQGIGKYTGTISGLKMTIVAKSVSTDDIDVTLSQSVFDYDGTEHKPTITKVTIPGEDAPIELSKDNYQLVNYVNNTNAGKASAGVKLINNFTSSTKSVSFTINPRPLTDEMVTLNKNSYTYLGQQIKPGVTVKDGDKTVPTSCYDVTYENNIDASIIDKGEDGNPKVIVTGKANYSGTITKNFTITKASSTVNLAQQSYEIELGSSMTISATTTPSGLGVSYKQDDPRVIQIDEKGNVTALAEGRTTVTVYTNGNNNYSYSEATCTITVVDNSVKYGIVINGTQVTDKNCNDVFGDGDPTKNHPASFTYNSDKNILIVCNSQNQYRIECTKSDGFTLYLAPQSSNKIGEIINTSQSADAKLTITTDGNYPGSLTLSRSNGSAVIGFTTVRLEQNLCITKPEGVTINNGQISTTDEVTIAVPMTPITKNKVITPDATIEEGQEGGNVNKIVNDVLYTLGAINDPNGDGFDDDLKCIVINSVTSDLNAKEVSIHLTPGTIEFLEHMKGLTFMVPAGKGKITIVAQTEDGFKMKVNIGETTPFTIEKPEKGDVIIPYNVEEPTYVYIYNGGKTGSKARSKGIAKGGKKSVTHVRVYGTTITPSKVTPSNSVSSVAGDSYKGYDPNENNIGEDFAPIEGDVNCDDKADGNDVRDVVNYIMGFWNGSFDKYAADMNNDNVINIADIIKILKKVK